MMKQASMPEIRHAEPLARHTTLGVGGPADYYSEVATPEEATALLDTARNQGWSLTVLGGGSNVVVADAGVRGLVVRYVDRSFTLEDVGDEVIIRAGAGLPWDE